ncbi:hypothetical protein ACFLR8_04730 [Bacteroidota bacterium]
MKRLLLPIICMAVLFGCSTEKAPEPTTELGWFTPYTLMPEILKGQVNSLEQKTYWVTEQDGEYVQGALITRKERDSLNWSWDFIAYFDSLGLAKKVKFLDDEGEITGHWKINTEDGKFSRAEWFEGDSAKTYWKIFYDDAGHLLKEERYRSYVDTFMNQYEFKTDEQGQWILAQFVKNNGEAGNTRTSEYNEAGQVVARETINPEGNVIGWMKHTYDEKGLQASYDGMGSDSIMYSGEMKYIDFDESGNWLKVVYYEKGELNGMEVRTIEYK